MDGSAADDLKSLKLLVKELSLKLAESREDDGKLDDLISAIAADAGIDYKDFKRRQLAKNEEYFSKNGLPKVDEDGDDLRDDVSVDDGLDELDKEILHYQNENMYMEQQIQRNEFLISKYLPLLEREEEILKGLHDFLEDKAIARANGEKIVQKRFENEKKAITERIRAHRKTKKQQELEFARLMTMWSKLNSVIEGDLADSDKMKTQLQTMLKDIKLFEEIQRRSFLSRNPGDV